MSFFGVWFTASHRTQLLELGFKVGLELKVMVRAPSPDKPLAWPRRANLVEGTKSRRG